jgi:glutamyl-tRNA synthetase
MSVTISDTGGKLSKRERPNTLRTYMKEHLAVSDYTEVAAFGGVGQSDIQSFVEGKTTPDMPVIDAMAEYLGVPLPEINIVDFFRSGYLPETMVNFLALLGWNPGDEREIMKVNELVESFDIARLTKSNSLFDRQKLLAFNTAHIKMLLPEKLLVYLKDYLKAVESPLTAADDETLLKIIKLCEGARTLADIDRKSRFLFQENKDIQYDDKAIEKVLQKSDGLNILQTIKNKIETQAQITAQNTEEMLRNLAEEKHVSLGKVAQPLRVALCGSTVSISIFEAVEMLGKDKTLARIDNTLAIVQGKAVI